MGAMDSFADIPDDQPAPAARVKVGGEWRNGAIAHMEDTEQVGRIVWAKYRDDAGTLLYGMFEPGEYEVLHTQTRVPADI